MAILKRHAEFPTPKEITEKKKKVEEKYQENDDSEKPQKKLRVGGRNSYVPARVQREPGTIENRLPQTGTVFNIWYLKWSGGDKDDAIYSQRKADSRCIIRTDSGYTKADKIPGSYFCLYFARGMCSRGKNCDYLHRLPDLTDIFPQHIDCFGRDKFADYRDDMGGVGSFLRQTRTLYIGRINGTENTEETVSRHFQEWGDIERIRVLNNRGVAFVTYMNEANSQFAKEAMSHQSLDNDEILNVRWASDDPNPLAQAREKKNIEKQTVNAIQGLLNSEVDSSSTSLYNEKDPGTKDISHVQETNHFVNTPITSNISSKSTGLVSRTLSNSLSTLTTKGGLHSKDPIYDSNLCRPSVGVFSSEALSVLKSTVKSLGKHSESTNIVPDYDSDEE